MSTAKPRKGKTDTAQASLKLVKGEGKQESKQVDKAQPTAEQMRIAQIIDTKTEDPTLKDKIRQVMDATQKSEDEVCTALHDCDNDPDRAVNLLIEGVQSEWSTSMKKKKRAEKVKDPNVNVCCPAQQDDSDWEDNAEEIISPLRATEARAKTRPPIYKQQGRGQLRSVELPEIEQDRDIDRLARGRISNGPSRGRGGSRNERGFGRGMRPFKKPLVQWEGTNLNNHDSPSQVDDWDDGGGEYTGSLADSQVFTSSSASDAVPDEEQKIIPDDRESVRSTSPTEPRQSMIAVQFLSQLASSQQANKSGSTPSCSVFHEPHFTRDSFSNTFAVNSFASPGSDNSASPGVRDVRLPRISTRIRPRIPPPSKIPSTAVEMPPDAVGASMALLDVQFGALDFADTGDTIQQPGNSTPPPRSPSPSTSDKLAPSTMNVTEALLISDSSFSPVRSAGSTTIAQMNELNSSKSSDNVQSGLYQDSVYPPSQFAKSSHTQASSFGSSFSNNPQVTSTSSGYSVVSNASSCASNYSTSGGNYTNAAYPPYHGYPTNYPSHSQTLAIPHLHSSNSYQSGVSSQYSCSQNSVYGTTGLGSTSSSYSAPYQSYSGNPQHNHKTSLSTVSNSSKDFETSPSVNLNSIAPATTMNAPSLLTSTQTTCSSKPSSMSTMSKGAVVTGMAPGVPPIVSAQYIMSQGGVPYFQQPVYSYEELQLVPQQRLPPPHLTTGYFEVGYQTPTTREGVQYNISDGRFARADNNTSPVQASSINQQSGTQAHQQPLMNPTAAIPPAYAYFYGGSVIPGSFQYGTPTLYPVAATGTSSGHNSNSGVFKGPATYAGGYGNYEGGQGADYKTGTQASKSQSVQTNPASSSDMPLYSKSHATMPKSYEKSGFHPGTPPPFTLNSQNSGIGPTGYAPQHLFIPAMTPHNTPMMHQPLHQDSGSSVSARAQVSSQSNKVGNKANYSPSYWSQN